MPTMPNELLTTVEAARVAGVGASSVKRWADDGLLSVIRTVGGHRRFDRAALDRFLRSRGADDDDPFVATILAAQRHAVEGALLEARARLGAWHRVADEVALALVELGERWASGRVSIAEEHVASECLLRSLARVTDVVPSRTDANVCLLACVEGDEHTLPLALAELVLRESGWGARWLGRQTPKSEILRIVRNGEVEMIAVSASAAQRDTARLAELAFELGSACRESGVGFVVGGSGAWPDPLEDAERLRSFTALHDYLVAKSR
jgi:excisionase family DNA binding protein